MKKELSWEYGEILTETIGDKYIEIFEYRSKVNVRIGEVGGGFLDVLSTEDENKAWVFYNKLLESFWAIETK